MKSVNASSGVGFYVPGDKKITVNRVKQIQKYADFASIAYENAGHRRDQWHGYKQIEWLQRNVSDKSSHTESLEATSGTKMVWYQHETDETRVTITMFRDGRQVERGSVDKITLFKNRTAALTENNVAIYENEDEVILSFRGTSNTQVAYDGTIY